MTFVISPDGLSPVLEAQGWKERTDPSMLSSGFHMYTMYGMCVSGKNKFKNLKTRKLYLFLSTQLTGFFWFKGNYAFLFFSVGLPQRAELSGRARDFSLSDGDREGLYACCYSGVRAVWSWW